MWRLLRLRIFYRLWLQTKTFPRLVPWTKKPNLITWTFKVQSRGTEQQQEGVFNLRVSVKWTRGQIINFPQSLSLYFHVLQLGLVLKNEKSTKSLKTKKKKTTAKYLLFLWMMSLQVLATLKESQSILNLHHDLFKTVQRIKHPFSLINEFINGHWAALPLLILIPASRHKGQSIKYQWGLWIIRLLVRR